MKIAFYNYSYTNYIIKILEHLPAGLLNLILLLLLLLLLLLEVVVVVEFADNVEQEITAGWEAGFTVMPWIVGVARVDGVKVKAADGRWGGSEFMVKTGAREINGGGMESCEAVEVLTAVVLSTMSARPDAGVKGISRFDGEVDDVTSGD